MSTYEFVTDQEMLQEKALEVPAAESYDSIRHASQALIFSRYGSILILKKQLPKKEQIFQDMPGGGLEPGEDHLRGLDRELREELGLKPSGYYIPFSFSFTPNKSPRRSFATMTFVATIMDEISPTVDPKEHVGFQWMKWGHIPAPYTGRLASFLREDIIDRLRVEDIAIFARGNKPLYCNTQELGNPDPSLQLPDLGN